MNRNDSMSEQRHGPTSAPSSSPHQLRNIVTPHDHDVLSGRGNFVNYHVGNEHFRALVKKHKIAYVACPKSQKGKFSRLIVDEIRSMNPPGRFLKQDPETKLWHDIGDKKALDKTRQALREGAPELLKELHGSDEEVDHGQAAAPNEVYNMNGHLTSPLPEGMIGAPQSNLYGTVGSISGILPVITVPQPPSQIHPISQIQSSVGQASVALNACHIGASGVPRENINLPAHQNFPIHGREGLPQKPLSGIESLEELQPIPLSLQKQLPVIYAPVSRERLSTSKHDYNSNHERTEGLDAKNTMVVSYPADEFEPTPINPDRHVSSACSGGEQGTITIRLPAADPPRKPPPQTMEKSDSLRLNDLYKGPLVKASKSGTASSGNMSFSIADLDASNLSAVFEDSLVISDGSSSGANSSGRGKKDTKDSHDEGREKTPELAVSSNSLFQSDLSFAMSQTADFTDSSLNMMSFSGGLDEGAH